MHIPGELDSEAAAVAPALLEVGQCMLFIEVLTSDWIEGRNFAI